MPENCVRLQYKSMSPARNFECQYETMTVNMKTQTHSKTLQSLMKFSKQDSKH